MRLQQVSETINLFNFCGVSIARTLDLFFPFSMTAGTSSAQNYTVNGSVLLFVVFEGTTELLLVPVQNAIDDFNN